MADTGGSFNSSTRAPGELWGLTLSNNSGDPTNDIDIATGACLDGQSIAAMALNAALTKRLDAAWAVGSGNGGLDTGSIADTTYHVFLIKRTDTGVVDALFSTSATSPTMPSGYLLKRRVGSIVRASGAIVQFTQRGDEFLRMTSAEVSSGANPGTSASLHTLGVPAGIQVEGIITSILQDTTPASATALYISSPDQTDAAAGTSGSYTQWIGQAGATVPQANGVTCNIRTNTSAQVRARLSASNADIIYYISTHGWIDARGR